MPNKKTSSQLEMLLPVLPNDFLFYRSNVSTLGNHLFGDHHKGGSAKFFAASQMQWSSIKEVGPLYW